MKIYRIANIPGVDRDNTYVMVGIKDGEIVYSSGRLWASPAAASTEIAAINKARRELEEAGGAPSSMEYEIAKLSQVPEEIVRLYCPYALELRGEL